MSNENEAATAATPAAETEPIESGFSESDFREFVSEERPELLAGEPQPEEAEKEEGASGPTGTMGPAETEGENASGASGLVEGASGPSGGATGSTEQAASGAAGVQSTLPEDLDKLEKETADPHMRPKTRKIIDRFKTAAVQARQLAEQEAKARKQLETDLKTAQEAAKTVKAPKEMEDELTALRTRVRELDAASDPVLVEKYDKRVDANTDATIKILAEMGLFWQKTGEDDKKNPIYREMNEKEKNAEVARIKAGGVGLRSMAEFIKKLSDAGNVADAEQLRELARENDRLAREKANEIASFKTDGDGRRTREAEKIHAEQERLQGQVTNSAQTEITAKMGELRKAFPFVDPPPSPEANDPPAVAAAKKQALDEFNAARVQVEKIVDSMNPGKVESGQAPAAQGRQTAAAVIGVIIEHYVLPRLRTEISVKDTRITQLEGELTKLRKAGTMNRAHSAAITRPAGSEPEVPAGASIADGIAAFAKERGIDVSS